MKLDVSKLAPLFATIRRYRVLLFTLLFLGTYGMLTYRINQLTMQEPSQQAVSERLKTVKRITVDKESINQLEQLESQNIDVQSLFNQARNNPFTE